jgi:hypothetical protein
MQLLQAGHHKFILLELEPDLVGKIAKQCGFSSSVGDNDRSLVVELTAEERETPLLLFDATDPSNLGWFSRCQFYVDGGTGAVLQTPISVANQKDGAGRILPQSIRVQIAKELPESFRLPGKQPVTEQSVYSVLANFLTALIQSGVAICGGSVVKPLSGRIDGAGTKN